MIQVTNKYFIDADRNSFIVLQKTKTENKSTGEMAEKFNQIAYFTRIEGCIDYIYRLHLMKGARGEGKAMQIKEYLQWAETLHIKFSNLLKSIVVEEVK